MVEPRQPKTLIRQLGEYRSVDYIAGASLLIVLVGFALWPAWDSGVGHRPRSGCKNNLKQFGLALHNYHEQYKTFPPAFVIGPDGKPWHSWRVLILPFLNEEKLFAQYRFDEPWNGPHNSLLANRRPDVFVCPNAKEHIPPSHTTYLAVLGADTVWPGKESIAISNILDGMSNTVLILEVRDAGNPWLAPDDLSFAEACVVPSDQSGRRPSSFHTGGSHVLVGDGTVRFVNSTVASETWKGLLTRDGGEAIEDF